MEDFCKEQIYNMTFTELFDSHSFIHHEFPGNTQVWTEPDLEGYIKLFAYAIIIIGGLLGNISVILTVALIRSMRTTINIYIANLAVADCLICIICMATHALTELTGSMFVLGEFMCKFNPFTQMTSLTCSVLSLCAISCDRFMAVMFPLRRRVTKNRPSVVITIIWIISTVVSIPMLIFRKYTFLEWKNFKEPKCSEDWPVYSAFYDESTEMCVPYQPLRSIYYVLMSVTLFFVPITVMVTVYSLVIWKLWRSEIPGEQNEANVQAHSKSRKKVIKMVFSVLIAFIICWTPLQFTLLFDLSSSFMEFEWFAYYIAYANSFINPFIYGGFNKAFRDGFCNLLTCNCTRDTSGRLARWRSTLSTRLTVINPGGWTRTITDSRRITAEKLNL